MSGKIKYYFQSQSDEICYTLDYHLANAKDEGLAEIELIKAIPEKVGGMFWCKAVDECAEDGCCGKMCDEYEPKNGKSGMCKYRCNTFYGHGKKITISLKQENKQ